MARDPKSSKDAFARITNPDGTPVRDKDNAQTTLKPNYSQRPAPNLAPAGAMGIRQPRPHNPLVPRNDNATQERVMLPSFMTIDSDIQADTHRYITGHFSSDPQISFLARVSHDPTPHGFNGSRVEQLVLKEGDETIMRHNFIARDADIPPQTEEHEQLADRVCSMLDRLPEREPAPDRPIMDEPEQSPPPESDRLQFTKSTPPDERLQFTKSENPLVPGSDEAGIVIDEGHPSQDQWQDGRIITMPGYSFSAKVEQDPSEHGIKGGTITQLDLQKDGETVVLYDRGWDIAPNDTEHREAIQRIRNGLDHTVDRQREGHDQSSHQAHKTNDKDHDMDR